MPTRKTPPERNDQPLKAVLDAARKGWYKEQRLIPGRVGRPGLQWQLLEEVFAIHVRPVLARLEQWRARHPDRPFLRISQGRVQKLVSLYLDRKGYQPVDKSLIRKRCKMQRLIKELHTGQGIHWPNLRWVVKHSPSIRKEIMRVFLAARIEEMLWELLQNATAQALVKRLVEIPPGPERDLLKKLWEPYGRPLREVIGMFGILCENMPRRRRKDAENTPNEDALDLYQVLKEHGFPLTPPAPNAPVPDTAV
jgi:hypothetical protein